MGSGDLVKATGKGTLVVDTSQGRRYIEEVLLVPGLDENLLSVGQMMEDGYYILFGGNKAIIFEDESLKNVLARVVMKGNRCFPLSLETLMPAAKKASVVEESWIWHKRLGHLGLLHHFLGMGVLQSEESIFIHQGKYARTLLEKFGLADCKPVSTPLFL